MFFLQLFQSDCKDHSVVVETQNKVEDTLNTQGIASLLFRSVVKMQLLLSAVCSGFFCCIYPQSLDSPAVTEPGDHLLNGTSSSPRDIWLL